MNTRDSRIPVLFGEEIPPGRGDAVLVGEPDGLQPDVVAWRDYARDSARGHALGCRCCGGRSAASLVLVALFHARARGEVAPFRRLVVKLGAAEETQIRAALAGDAFVAGRYVAG
jgi:hypothetical protein